MQKRMGHKRSSGTEDQRSGYVGTGSPWERTNCRDLPLGPTATLTCVSCSWDSRVEKSLVSLLDLLSDWVRRPVTLSSSTYARRGDTKAHELTVTALVPLGRFQAKLGLNYRLTPEPRLGVSLKQERERKPWRSGPRPRSCCRDHCAARGPSGGLT